MLIIRMDNVRGQDELCAFSLIISLSKLETPSRMRLSLHMHAWLVLVNVGSLAA